MSDVYILLSFSVVGGLVGCGRRKEGRRDEDEDEDVK